MVGGVGNTGNATAPHIHINLFDQVDDLLRAQVVPFVFGGCERWDGKAWEVIERCAEEGEVVRPCESAGERCLTIVVTVTCATRWGLST